MKILLIGSPNVGKTTLFNYLTGSNQRIGNFAGTTVGFKSGNLKFQGKDLEIVDTPGLYSLYNDQNLSITDKMVRDLLIKSKYDLIINVITPENLHHNLLLTCHLLDLAVPTVVVVNVDEKSNNYISNTQLETHLGCKVVKLNFNHLEGLNKKQSLFNKIFGKKATPNNDTPENTSRDINTLLKEIILNVNYVPAPRIFYGMQLENKLKKTSTPEDRFNLVFENIEKLNINTKVSKFISKVVQHSTDPLLYSKKDLSDKLDNIFLNKFIGVPIFLIIMYFFFYIVISFGKVFQDFFESLGDTFFVDIPSYFFNYFHMDNFLTTTLISLGSTLQIIGTFVPLLFIFYFCLGFLENSGYMSRGAYLTDGIMRAFGLPGKSLITVIISFGCAVPGVLSSRTISNNVERILTIVALPFVACSARLTVFILFVAIFFPSNAINIIYFLYIFGMIIGIFTVWFFKLTLFKHKESFFILELPRYRMPKIWPLVRSSLYKVKDFCFRRTFKIILPIVIILNILHYATTNSDSIKNSKVLNYIHHTQVVFLPMGITYDNWEAPVSLIGGAIAKETVITSLNSLYLLGKADTEPAQTLSIKEKLNESLGVIKEGFGNLIKKLTFNVDINSDDYSSDLAKAMAIKFGSVSAVFAYLVFTLLYTPCLVTLGAVRKEIGSKWMHFINTWSILIAYIFATSSYQVLNFSSHPVFSTCWIIGCILFFLLCFKMLSKIKLKNV
ncbi:ferrous iron transport protein B [Rickettsiales bacterium LUAb2]